eukprot:4262024-Alexandrium_andersonii.AAC.1
MGRRVHAGRGDQGRPKGATLGVHASHGSAAGGPGGAAAALCGGRLGGGAAPRPLRRVRQNDPLDGERGGSSLADGAARAVRRGGA